MVAGQSRDLPQWHGFPAPQPQPQAGGSAAEADWQPQVQAAPWQLEQWQVEASL